MGKPPAASSVRKPNFCNTAKKLLELLELERPRSSLAAGCAAWQRGNQSQGHEGPTVTPRLFRGLAGTSRRPALGVAS